MQLGILQEDHFRNPRHEDLFNPPLILIKEHESLPMAFWDRDFLAYQDIVGIHAHPSDCESLYSFYKACLGRRCFYHFVFFHASKEWSRRRPPSSSRILTLSPFRIMNAISSYRPGRKVFVEDVLRYMTSFIRLGHFDRGGSRVSPK